MRYAYQAWGKSFVFSQTGKGTNAASGMKKGHFVSNL